MKRILTVMTAASLLLGATAAMAQTTKSATSPTNNNNIEATVITNCTISTFALNFDDYDPTSTSAKDAGPSTINIRCTKGTTGVTVSLNNGLNTGRRMKHQTTDTEFLDYELYHDNAGGTPWPVTGTSTVAAPSFAGTNLVQMNVYGRIPAHENVIAGKYFDTVVATVNY